MFGFGEKGGTVDYDKILGRVADDQAASQAFMAELTSLNNQHKMIMSAFEAVKNAFQQIKG